MLYRLFLYRIVEEPGEPLRTGNVIFLIAKENRNDRDASFAADLLRPFDTAAILHRIQEDLTDPATGRCLCSPKVCYPPAGCAQTAYLYLATSYEKAAEVLPRLYDIALHNDLVLYDAETDRSFYMDVVAKSYLTMQNRQAALCRTIRELMAPIWHIRRLELISDDEQRACSYAVTLRKARDRSFAQRNADFYALLTQSLQDDEKLSGGDRCYIIRGPGYKITYVLEGYKDSPNQIGFVKNGIPCTDLLHRMGAYNAFKFLDRCKWEDEVEAQDILTRMTFREMVKAYPNPAQRLVESVKITKWQRRQIFDLRYSGSDLYFGEIVFSVSRLPGVKRGEVSDLKIAEESATFLLPFINDIYPDFYERYYMTSNLLSSQMWERIMERLRQAKEMILHDTFDPELKPYIKSFNFYVFSDFNLNGRDDKAQFLYKHRYDVARFYDVFLQWSEAQFEAYYHDEDLMFSIYGP